MAKRIRFFLKKFQGLHASENGGTDLSDGESPEMINFKVTSGGGLERRDGFSGIVTLPEAVRGLWYGKIGGQRWFCAVAGFRFYAGTEGFDAMTDRGGVGGEGEVCFLPFGKKLHVLTGQGIWTFDGASFSGLKPYAPLVMIHTLPDGTGTEYEEVNLLTGRVRQEFDLSGEAAVDFFPAMPPVAIESVKIDGVTVDPETYFWDDIRGCLTFLHAPRPMTKLPMEVAYEIDSDDRAAQAVLSCRCAMKFGGANDTRAFLYGSARTPSVRYHTGLAGGEPALEYVPASGYTLVGDSKPITAILRHYDRQILFTPDGAYYSYLEYLEKSDGSRVSVFPVYPLSEDAGCLEEGEACVMQNDPVTLSRQGLCRWISTNVRDERNASLISGAINARLRAEDLSGARLFNRRAAGELYLLLPGKIYVYQYERGVFTYYETPVIGCLCEAESELYFAKGKTVCRVGGEDDDGEAIRAIWRSRPFDLGAAEKRKHLFRARVRMKKGGARAARLSFVTEREEGGAVRLPASGEDRADTLLASARVRARRFFTISVSIENENGERLHLTSMELEGLITEGEK